MSGSASEQRGRRMAIVVRQCLLMVVAMIEREFGLRGTAGQRLNVTVEVVPDPRSPADLRKGGADPSALSGIANDPRLG